VVFRLAAVALKLSITSEMPAAQNRTAIKLRELTKPDLEEDCFFIGGICCNSLFGYRRVGFPFSVCAIASIRRSAHCWMPANEK
jgi:hypothetical protein